MITPIFFYLNSKVKSWIDKAQDTYSIHNILKLTLDKSQLTSLESINRICKTEIIMLVIYLY